VTAILIATSFSPEIQGYYYTFSTLLALQIFLQLGLGTVVSQFASHEWAKLGLNESGMIAGDRESLSRLSSIAGIAFKWYWITGILVFIGVGMGGYFFFSTSPANPGITWILPWFFLCLMEGVSICLVPIWSLLEGCNQVSRLYTFRFFQGFVTSITIWICMICGAKLWTAGISVIVYVISSLFFLRHHYWNYIKTLLFSEKTEPRIDWRVDMLPMQWRIALSWMSGYFIFSLFVPVLFKYHGPLLAGQMGMTWSLVAVLGAVSSAWLSPKAPVFGMLIAQGDYGELDRQFWKTTKIVICISAIMAFMIWLAVVAVNNFDIKVVHKFSHRLLPPLPTGLFLAAQLLYITSTPFATYLRAHKKEPLMVFSLIYAVLVGASTFLLGRYYSVVGMALGYLVVNVLLMPSVYFIWKRCRIEWHMAV
jgi:O-antigen/teichoic acid export membrane protein